MIDHSNVRVGDRLTLEVEVIKVFPAAKTVYIKMVDDDEWIVLNEKSSSFRMSSFNGHTPVPPPVTTDLPVGTKINYKSIPYEVRGVVDGCLVLGRRDDNRLAMVVARPELFHKYEVVR